MNNLLKVNKILIITLIVFSVGVFGSYSKTASKYLIQDISDNILNKTSFKGLTQEVEPSITLIGDKAQITIDFFRTAAVDDSSVVQDEIEFSLLDTSEKCRIINVSNSKNGTSRGFYKNESNSYAPVPKEGEYQNNITFTYNDITSNISNDTAVTLTIECDAEDILVTDGNKKDYLKVEYRAIEKIQTNNSEEKEKFKMFGGLYYSSKKYEKPVKDSYIISDDKKKLTLISTELTDAILNEWVDAYVSKYYSNLDKNTVTARFKAYLNSIYSTPDKITGLVVNGSKTEFEFSDLIVSYAYTNYTKNNKPVALYFMDSTVSNTDYDVNNSIVLDKNTIDDMFTYYYNLYYRDTPVNEEDDKKILKYISDNGGVSSFILDKKPISGIVSGQTRSITINKAIIRTILNPVTPDIIIDFKDYQGKNKINLYPVIASSVKSYVETIYGISFDTNMILENVYFRDYFSSIEGNTTVDKYYYLALGNDILPMRIYYNGTNYTIHLDTFDGNNLAKNVDMLVFSSVEKKYKTSTNYSDYADFINVYKKYLAAINNTYNTNFNTTNTADDLDKLIAGIITDVQNGVTAFNKTMTVTDPSDSNNQIVIRFQSTSTYNYGVFAVEFNPSTVTTQSTTSDELANAVTTGGLSGLTS